MTEKPTVIKYKVNISDSALDHLHGMFHEIDECFIPEHGLCFNLANGNLNVFEEKAPRAEDGEEIVTTKSFIKLIKDFYERKKEIIESATDIFQPKVIL